MNGKNKFCSKKLPVNEFVAVLYKKGNQVNCIFQIVRVLGHYSRSKKVMADFSIICLSSTLP